MVVVRALLVRMPVTIVEYLPVVALDSVVSLYGVRVEERDTVDGEAHRPHGEAARGVGYCRGPGDGESVHLRPYLVRVVRVREVTVLVIR